MLKEKISSNPDLFKREKMVVDKALTSENLGKVKNELSTILTTPSINGAKPIQCVTTKELNEFIKGLGVSDECGITQNDFNTKLTQFFTKEGINVNDIGAIIEQLDRPNGVDSNDYFTKGMAEVQVVDTNYLYNLTTVFEKASTQAIFSDLHSIKQGAILVRDNLAENGIITKEIASENGLSTELVAGTELTLLGTVVAVLAGFTGIAFKKLFNKNKEENKEKEVDKQSQKTTQMKQGLSQAKTANAICTRIAFAVFACDNSFPVTALSSSFACCFFPPLNKLLHPSITFFAANVPRPIAKPVPSIAPPYVIPSAICSALFPVILVISFVSKPFSASLPACTFRPSLIFCHQPNAAVALLDIVLYKATLSAYSVFKS